MIGQMRRFFGGTSLAEVLKQISQGRFKQVADIIEQVSVGKQERQFLKQIAQNSSAMVSLVKAVKDKDRILLHQQLTQYFFKEPVIQIARQIYEQLESQQQEKHQMLKLLITFNSEQKSSIEKAISVIQSFDSIFEHHIQQFDPSTRQFLRILRFKCQCFIKLLSISPELCKDPNPQQFQQWCLTVQALNDGKKVIHIMHQYFQENELDLNSIDEIGNSQVRMEIQQLLHCAEMEKKAKGSPGWGEWMGQKIGRVRSKIMGELSRQVYLVFGEEFQEANVAVPEEYKGDPNYVVNAVRELKKHLKNDSAKNQREGIQFVNQMFQSIYNVQALRQMETTARIYPHFEKLYHLIKQYLQKGQEKDIDLHSEWVEATTALLRESAKELNQSAVQMSLQKNQILQLKDKIERQYQKIQHHKDEINKQKGKIERRNTQIYRYDELILRQKTDLKENKQTIETLQKAIEKLKEENSSNQQRKKASEKAENEDQNLKKLIGWLMHPFLKGSPQQGIQIPVNKLTKEKINQQFQQYRKKVVNQTSRKFNTQIKGIMSHLQPYAQKSQKQFKEINFKLQNISPMMERGTKIIEMTQKLAASFNKKITTAQTKLAQVHTLLNQSKQQNFYQNETIKNQNTQIMNLKQRIKNSRIYGNFFEGFIFNVAKDGECQQSKFVVEAIQQCVQKRFLKTDLLYRFDPKNVQNFHNYFDDRPNLVLIARLQNGKEIVAFSQPAFCRQNIKGQGLIISLSNREIFELNKSNEKTRPYTYDDYYLIFGNSEIRIKTLDNVMFSNLGILNNFYDNRKHKVSILLGGEEKEREVLIETYEIFQVTFK